MKGRLPHPWQRRRIEIGSVELVLLKAMTVELGQVVVGCTQLVARSLYGPPIDRDSAILKIRGIPRLVAKQMYSQMRKSVWKYETITL